MKKQFLLLVKGLALGLAGGMILAAAVLALYRLTHAIPEPDRVRYVNRYFLTVGALLGLLGGWVAGLHAVLWNIIQPVLWKTAGILPATLGRIDALWIRSLSEIMNRVLARTGFVLRGLIGRIFMPELRDGLARYNEAVERARRKDPRDVSTPQGLSFVALKQFTRPLWIFFHLGYIVVAIGFLVFLGIPFLR